jgi:hypothetical protein
LHGQNEAGGAHERQQNGKTGNQPNIHYWFDITSNDTVRNPATALRIRRISSFGFVTGFQFVIHSRRIHYDRYDNNI